MPVPLPSDPKKLRQIAIQAHGVYDELYHASIPFEYIATGLHAQRGVAALVALMAHDLKLALYKQEKYLDLLHALSRNDEDEPSEHEKDEIKQYVRELCEALEES